MIKYQKGSLFSAPKDSYLVHACNTVGVWGSGIAVEFKRRFPHAFAVYERNCLNNSDFILGQFWAIWDGNYNITCLMVSKGYGRNKDSKEDILKRTEEAVLKLLKYVSEQRNPLRVIHSNKFNSGFFAVPWEETEAVLERCLKQYPTIEWVVMDPDLKTVEQQSAARNKGE